MTDQTANVLMDIEQALQAAQNSLPMVLAVAGTFYPPLKAVTPFLPLLQVALTAVQQAEQTMNVPTHTAVQHVTTVLQAAPGTSQGPSSN